MLSGENPARRIVSRTASVRAVSQVQLLLVRNEDDAFRKVQEEVLEWMRRKAGRALPKAAWDGLTFELDEVGAQRVTAAHLEEPRYWAARVDDADRDVAQRTWTSEIGVAEASNGRVLLGCRLVVSARGENPVYQPSIPVFIRDVVRGGGAFLDDRELKSRPWVVQSQDDVTQLCELLSSKTRRVNVCVFSLGPDETDPATASASADSVHRLTLGAAHVVVLTGPAAFMLTDRIGREFSVFNRAVRTYRPAFNTDSDDPMRHPVAMATRIALWQDFGLHGPDAFESFLVRNTILHTVSHSDLERVLPPFSEVRRIAAGAIMAIARDAGATNDDLLRLFEEENARLRAALDEEKALHNGLLAAADRDRDDGQRRMEEAKGEVYRLNQRIRTLESQFKGISGPETSSVLLKSLADLKEWSDANLSGSVVVTNRALRGAKESDYEDPQLAFRALLLLRDHYVPMRRGRDRGLAESYAKALAELGLEEDRSMTANRLGEQGDEYLVHHNGKKWKLNRHYRKGTSRQSRHCFRLYFFWDDEEEQVVVGWLTSHLDTRQT
jgi:hypothetical protein